MLKSIANKVELVYSIIWIILTGVLVNFISSAFGAKEFLLGTIIALLGIFIIHYLKNLYYQKLLQKRLVLFWKNRYQNIEYLRNIKYVTLENQKIIPELLYSQIDEIAIVICKVETDILAKELFTRIEKPIVEKLWCDKIGEMNFLSNNLPIQIKLDEKKTIESTLFEELEAILDLDTNDFPIKPIIKKKYTKERGLLLLVEAQNHNSEIIKNWISNHKNFLLPKWINKIIITVPKYFNENINLSHLKTKILNPVRFPETISNTEKLVKEKIIFLGKSNNEMEIRNRLELLALKFCDAELSYPEKKIFNSQELKFTSEDNLIVNQLGDWVLVHDKEKIWTRYQWNPHYQIEKCFLVAYGLEEGNVISQTIFKKDIKYLKLLNNSLQHGYVRLILDEKLDLDEHILSDFKLNGFHNIIKELWGKSTEQHILSNKSISYLNGNDILNFMHINDKLNLINELIKTESLHLISSNLDSLSIIDKGVLIFEKKLSISAFCKARRTLINDLELLTYFNKGNQIPNEIISDHYLSPNSCMGEIVLILSIAPYGPLPTKKQITLLKRALLKNTNFDSFFKISKFSEYEKNLISTRINFIANHLDDYSDIWLEKMNKSLHNSAQKL